MEGVLGEGGMGRVYLARHLELGGRVALKVLRKDRLPRVSGERDAARERLRREARAVSRIRGEHVARVMDAGVSAEHGPFFVMEHVEGKSLQALLSADGPLPETRAVRYVLEVALALAEAHALGIVHRDLKPSNLFLTTRPDGTELVKVLDFGIAKADALAGTLTDTASLLGSPKYMSPEQIREARSVDARSDVWSLGVVLYELLTGRLPFEAYTATGVLSRIVTDDPTPMAEVFAGVTPDLEAVVLKMLAKAPDDRLASVAVVAAALAPFGDDGAAALAERVAKVLGTPRVWSGAPDAAPSVDEALPSTLPEPAVAAVDETVTAASRTHGDAVPAPSAPRPTASLGRAVPLAIGAALVVALAGAFAFGRGGDDRGPVQPTSTGIAATASGTPVLPSATASTAPAPQATESARPLAVASAPAASTAPAVRPSAVASARRTAPPVVASAAASTAAAFPDEMDFGPRK